jgi:predicted metal-dependent hydrolase
VSRDDVTRGLALARGGRWFEAHEAFEDAWRATPPGPRRDLLQALVHVAVAREHARRGNQAGAALQAGKARARLAAAGALEGDPLLAIARRLVDALGG